MTKNKQRGFAAENLTFGQMNAIIKKIGGVESSLRLLRGDLIVSLSPIECFPIWRNLSIGGQNVSGGSYHAACRLPKVQLSVGGSKLVMQMGVKTEKTEIDLVVLFVADLGLSDGATLDEVYNRARELGFGLCPAEVGPALALQYPDQPNEGSLHIGMELVQQKNGDEEYSCYFELFRSKDHIFLTIDNGNNILRNDRFVFVRPK